ALHPGGSVSGVLVSDQTTLDDSALPGPLTFDVDQPGAPGIAAITGNSLGVVGSASANDTLVGQTFTVTGPDSGHAASQARPAGVTFAGFEDLVGVMRTGNPSVTLAPGGSVSGTVDGGGGGALLDYSPRTDNITVTLPPTAGALGSATGIAGGIENFT